MLVFNSRLFTSIVILCSLGVAQARSGKFVGELILTPDPDDRDGIIMILKQDFGYIDAAGTEWLAKAGDKTDGASIPMPAWSFVGGPWEGRYREAAVLHDHYCQRRVRHWHLTHLMFHEAMLANGVSSPKASLLYYAVYYFGPRWGKLQPGTPCGQNCVFVVRSGETISVRKMENNNKLIETDLKEIRDEIEKSDAQGTPLDVDQLEAIANSKRPNDPFLTKGEVVK